VDHHSDRSTVDMRWGTVECSPELVLAGDSGHKASPRDDLAVEGDVWDLTLASNGDGVAWYGRAAMNYGGGQRGSTMRRLEHGGSEVTREMATGKYGVLLGALYRAGTARRGGGEEIRRRPVVEPLKLWWSGARRGTKAARETSRAVEGARLAWIGGGGLVTRGMGRQPGRWAGPGSKIQVGQVRLTGRKMKEKETTTGLARGSGRFGMGCQESLLQVLFSRLKFETQV
jgi:hypothetical protein